jgi:hypothetical protein
VLVLAVAFDDGINASVALGCVRIAVEEVEEEFNNNYDDYEDLREEWEAEVEDDAEADIEYEEDAPLTPQEIEEVKAEIEGSYPNAHVLIFDTVTEGALKIFFTEQKGLMLDYKQTQINIKPDKSIDVHTASGNSKIELLDDGKLNITNSSDITIKCDTKISITSTNETTIKCDKLIIDHASTIELGKGATEKVILGNKFMSLFNSHTHIGNLGAPTSPPIKPMTPAELSQKKVVVK